MAFSDLCHISNAYKTVENDTDQAERIMEENSIVRDLITKILDDGGPTDIGSSLLPPDKTLNGLQTNHYPKNDTANSFLPTPYNYQNLSNYNYSQNDQNGYNYNMQNGFGNTNGFVNYNDNDVNALLGVDLPDTSDTVSPEQLNLLRLAAQQIGGAQFQNNKYDYNFFEPNQRNSLPETNMFPPNNFRPNSLNLDMNYNNFENQFNNRYPNNFKDSQDPAEILSYLTQLNTSLERPSQENVNNMDFKMPLDLNGHYQNEELKMLDERNKMYYNRNYNQPNKNYENNHFFDNMMGQMDRSQINQMNFDYSNQSTPVSNGNFKPNGYHQNEFMQRRDMNQMMHREGFPNEQRNNFDNNGRDMQQIAMMRQNQELARQMSLLMRNRPPPNPLNVDVSFLHENNPYNLGLGALLGPSPTVQPPVLPSPMLDLPMLAPFYAMRNMRNAATSSGILHARLDACYEQWRQLERERKRTEARLALAYPGRAVSSSNSIPVPRLPPCPSRVDRLTVDMLREHTKVLTLMAKMETLRASVCIAQNKKKPEENKITVLKRGQENVANENKDGLDPASFDPSSWRDDVKHLAEIAPHKEVESAMLNWRNAVTAVQSARKREMHPPQHNNRGQVNDPILVLAEAVKQLCLSARRARTAMWCDLTLTVALAPPPACVQAESNQLLVQSTPIKQPARDTAPNASTNSKPTGAEAKEEKPATEPPKTEATTSTASATANTIKNGAAKQTDKDKNHQQRRAQNYKKVNQRNDFYRNQRYDSRFMQNRHPYQYLATGPIN